MSFYQALELFPPSLASAFRKKTKPQLMSSGTDPARGENLGLRRQALTPARAGGKQQNKFVGESSWLFILPSLKDISRA
jgi:hypothetical protein